MALRLIRQANETVRLDVTQGTGWKPAARGKFDASVNTYPELATIQATDCTGLRVYDYDAPGQPFWESTTGTSHALTVIKTSRRLVVRAENTTDKTEVIMHVIPIPPPCFVERLRAWWGGCHGAKETGATYRIRPRLVHHSLRRVGSATSAELQRRHHNRPTAGVRPNGGLHLQAGLRRREHPHLGKSHPAGHNRHNLGHLHLPSDLAAVGVAA